MSEKTFPNGFKSWCETHHEVVSYISTQLNMATGEDTEINQTHFLQGTGGMYEIAEEWTDEFETLHQGREWDGDFFDTIEEFVQNKNKVS